MLNCLKGNIKTLLGLCCSTGCFSKGDFEITINIAGKKTKRVMCKKHVEQFFSEHPECATVIETKEL